MVLIHYRQARFDSSKIRFETPRGLVPYRHLFRVSLRLAAGLTGTVYGSIRDFRSRLLRPQVGDWPYRWPVC